MSQVSVVSSGVGAQQGAGFWSGVRDAPRWSGEIGGAIRAPFTHIYRGLSNIYGGIRGMIAGEPGALKQAGLGLAELVLATLFSAINNNGGQFLDGTRFGRSERLCRG